MEVGGTYAVFSSGTGVFSVAGTLSLWIPILAPGNLTALPTTIPAVDPPKLTLFPTLFGVWRIVRPFGLRMTLSLPVTLAESPSEVLSLFLRPEVQPLDWLWLNVGAGIALSNGDDLLVPLDFELGVTPWGPLDLYASFAFPDLQGLGAEQRLLMVGARFRI